MRYFKLGGLTTLTTIAILTTAPAVMACQATQVACQHQQYYTGTGRRIRVILPSRQQVIVTVRPGQDDRAAAFEYLLKRPANTIADANALQQMHRVTGIWRQGTTDGIDIVEFQPW